ncbi:MAG TPA: MaoC family dehydratase N-terminal domain-containing protein [Burkholderiales bacterium]|nr:MaoC family dehydratase N-terminal domain-containing protein [Burkholderiales bacterium]
MRADASQMQLWIGREERVDVLVDALSVERMAALLDRTTAPRNGDALPALWHWMYLATPPRARDVGPDGHPATSALLPSVPMPRRMWAGSRVRFLGPVRVGERYRRVSTVRDLQSKAGKSGALVFVTIRHVLADANGPLIDEEQDIVYREASPAEARPEATEARDAAAPEFSRGFKADTLLLFRYSAVTFNAHRIHVDRAYATREEGYPGLVVHAPLVATLLLELLREQRSGARIDEVQVRARAPLVDQEPITLCGRLDRHEAKLWARAPGRERALTVDVTLGRDVHA